MTIRSKLAVAVFTGLAAVGCQNQHPQTAIVPLDTPPEKFEKSKDPPIQAMTYVAAGQLAQSQGNMEEAMAQFHKALKVNKNCEEAVFGIAMVYTQTQDFPHAVETWNQYIKMTGNSAAGYSNLGFCEEIAGNTTAAEEAYKKGIARDPHNEPCHVNYGVMLARHGKVNEALAVLQQV